MTSIRLTIALLCASILSLAYGQAPTSQATAQQLGQQLASAMQAAAATQNQSAVAFYNQGAAVAKSTGSTPPAPPMLTIVDTNAVVQLELQANQMFATGTGNPSSINWSSVYTQIQYVPIAAPPTPAAPPVVISSSQVPGYPGFYESTSGDGSSIPAGTTVTQGGHTYVKHVYGPFGSAMWQMVS